MTPAFKKGTAKVLAEASRVVRPIERELARREIRNGAMPGPVFIVGAPRCGSTLLFQVLVHAFEFSYFTNFTANFYHSPRTGFHLQRRLPHRAKHWESFSSRHGVTPGLWGPHECGKFWRRWFPGDRDFVGEEEYDEARFCRLREEVEAIAAIEGNPLLFKNLNCGQRLQVLTRLFPRALVLFCRRDSYYNAQSILIGRREVNGDERQWWSVRPKTFPELQHLSVFEQVARQVRDIETQIEDDRARLPASQSHVLRYEDLCENPGEEIRRIGEWLEANHLEVRRRNAQLPRLRSGNVDRLPESDAQELRKALGVLVKAG